MHNKLLPTDFYNVPLKDLILDRFKEIDLHIEAARNDEYTTIVVKMSNRLYSRYYCTFDKPDYTLLMADLTDAELDYIRGKGLIIK